MIHIMNFLRILQIQQNIILDMKAIKYEEAVRRLEEIVEQMENNELDIDSLSDKLKEAQELVKSCKDKLTKTDQEIKKLLDADDK